MVQYNFKEYIKLLKYDETLKQQKKSLEIENPSLAKKLSRYSSEATGFFHWSSRSEYLQLIDDFLTFKINDSEFDKQFSKKVQLIEQKSRDLRKNLDNPELKSIKPNWRSSEFSAFISEIYSCCNDFYPDLTEDDLKEMPFAITNGQLRNLIIEKIIIAFNSLILIE